MFQSREVPEVVFREVVLTEPVPREADAAAGEGVFVERRGDVAVHAAHALVVDVADVVPKSVVVLEGDVLLLAHLIGELIEIVGKPRTGPAGDETRRRGLGLVEIVRTNAAGPPFNVHSPAAGHLA